MEVKARCKFDINAIKALSHVSVFKKSNPKKTVIARAILFLVVLFLIAVELIAFGFDLILIVLFSVGILVITIDCFMFFCLPKIQYKSLAKMKDVENEYTFCDNILKVSSKSQEYNGEAEIEYSLFVRVYETSKYLFLYQTNNQVYIVDKSTIEGGTVEEIRNKLSAYIKGKYIICRY